MLRSPAPAQRRFRCVRARTLAQPESLAQSRYPLSTTKTSVAKAATERSEGVSGAER